MPIYGQCFGKPQITVEGETILFPFQKIEALLFYLFVNTQVRRDEAASLLWPDMEEKRAKKNLRNVIYQANKKLTYPVIASPNKAILTLNPELPIDADVRAFKKQPEEHLDLYRGEFLEGFSLKDSEAYELWLVKMRQHYRREFTNACVEKVKVELDQGENPEIEKLLYRLIDLDEFDEQAYHLLMCYYQKIDRLDKVVDTYYRLDDLLAEELGVTPSAPVREMYEAALRQLNQRTPIKKRRFAKRFFGRQDERRWLEQNLSHFKHHEPNYSVLLTGEEGVGKTSLVNRVLDNVRDDFYIFDTQCYQVEGAYNLRPFYRLIPQITKIIKEKELFNLDEWRATLSHYFPSMNLRSYQKFAPHMDTEQVGNFNVLSELLLTVFAALSESKPVLVVFSDAHWLDQNSWKVIESLVLNTQNHNMQLLLTWRSDAKQPYPCTLATLKKNDLLTEHEVKPLSLEETKNFARSVLENRELSASELQDLYHLTEGNLFFLEEALEVINNNEDIGILTIKMQAALAERFNQVSKQAKRLLCHLSYFYASVSLDFLEQELGIDEHELSELLTPLVEQGVLIEEVHEGELGVRFSHQRFREYFYQMESLTKRRAEHLRLAQTLAKAHQDDDAPNPLAKIAYHYKEAGEYLLEISYRIRYLEHYFDYYHELFPVEPDPAFQVNPYTGLASLWGMSTENSFQDVRHKLEDLTVEEGQQEAYEELLIRFNLMEGRYYLRRGAYDKAAKDLRQAIREARTVGHEEHLLTGYKQLIYLYIQMDRPDDMGYYLEQALRLAIKTNNYETMGGLLRLEGLHHLMLGELTEAWQRLDESIRNFTIVSNWQEKYSVSVAVAYDYIAEICSIKKQYRDAVDYQKRAIHLVEHGHVESTLYVFYINMGIIRYQMGEYELSLDYLTKAYEIYQAIPTSWKHGQLYAYLILVAWRLEKWSALEKWLRELTGAAGRFTSPSEQGFVAFAKAIIKKEIEEEPQKNAAPWAQAFAHSSEYYAEDARRKLNTHRNRSELDRLQKKIPMTKH